MKLSTLTSNIYNRAANSVKSFFLRGSAEKTVNGRLTKKGIYRILRRTHRQKVKMEMEDFRQAIDSALNPIRPDRRTLYSFYIQAMRETKLKSLVRTFTAEVQQSGFEIRNNGKADEDKKNFFEKSWFTKYIKYCISAYFYSHVLIEFKPKKREQLEFEGIEEIPREHVLPWKHQVLIRVTDTEGIDYTELPLCIEFGDSSWENLGLLESATEEVIRKKYARTDWSLHSEKFGMPIVSLKTATRDTKELDALEESLANMGSNGYMIIADSDEMDFAESNRSDPSRMYLPAIEYADKMLSLLVFGQQATSDEKSYVGSAEVQERIKNAFVYAALRDLQQHINEKLLPFLIENGYPLTNEDKFQYLDLLPKEDEGDNPKKEKEEETKDEPQKKNSKIMNVLSRFYATPMHIHLSVSPTLFDLEALINNAIDRIYKKRLRLGQLDGDLWHENMEVLNNALKKGGLAQVSYEHPRADLLYQFRRNVEVFAAFKNHANIADMVNALIDPNGEVRSFEDFKKEAARIGVLYNTLWLEAEYKLAVATTQQAVKWQDYQKNKDLLPNLKYVTMGDARVREEHRGLNGIIMPIDDAFWDEFHPPNGWGCRCKTLQIAGVPNPPFEDTEYNVDSYFRFNPAKSGEVFGRKHPYFRNLNAVQGRAVIRAMHQLKYDDYDKTYQKHGYNKTTGGYVVQHPQHTATHTADIANTVIKNSNEAIELLPDAPNAPNALVSGQLAQIVKGKDIATATAAVAPYRLMIIEVTETTNVVSQLKALINSSEKIQEVIVVSASSMTSYTREMITNL